MIRKKSCKTSCPTTLVRLQPPVSSRYPETLPIYIPSSPAYHVRHFWVASQVIYTFIKHVKSLLKDFLYLVIEQKIRKMSTSFLDMAYLVINPCQFHVHYVENMCHFMRLFVKPLDCAQYVSPNQPRDGCPEQNRNSQCFQPFLSCRTC
jgi:hypothetical protein